MIPSTYATKAEVNTTVTNLTNQVSTVTGGSIVASSIGPNASWIKFGNGVIIQWGTVYAPDWVGTSDSHAIVAAVFPVSFSVIPKIMHSCYEKSIKSMYNAPPGYKTMEKSISGFSFIFFDANTAVDWIAISK